ncbi:hypothetical protein CsSME_00048297 [Camellia sinensis var. sinensis]
MDLLSAHHGNRSGVYSSIDLPPLLRPLAVVSISRPPPLSRRFGRRWVNGSDGSVTRPAGRPPLLPRH